MRRRDGDACRGSRSQRAAGERKQLYIIIWAARCPHRVGSARRTADREADKELGVGLELRNYAVGVSIDARVYDGQRISGEVDAALEGPEGLQSLIH